MNAAAKQTIEQCFQPLKNQRLLQYHLTHDCFTGRPLAAHQLPQRHEAVVDVMVEKQQRDLNSLNEILYPTPTLGSVLGDSLAVLKVQTQLAETEAVVPMEKPSEDLVNRAKNWFDEYQSSGLATLLPAQSAQLTQASIAVIKRVFARNTILIRNVCMLSAFWVRSPLEWDTKGDVDLLDHLFVRYEAPAFLKACWSRVSDEESVRWLLCFIMYAQGGSLKELTSHFGWTVKSKKLWHQLFMCPAHLMPLHAVLYAEFKRLGGWDEDFACLMGNKSYVIDLLEPISEEGRDFWYDTCRWTINLQFEMTPEENSKVLKWARHQLTEFARHDEQYRLQGRSKAKVMDSIAAYEHEVFLMQRARDRMAERARQVSMAREEERERLRQEDRDRQALLDIENRDYYAEEPVNATWQGRGWDWEGTMHGKQWTIIELTTTQELYEEGEAMAHCVGGYSLSCLDGYAAIFSLMADGYRVTIEVDPMSKKLTQAQGLHNYELEKCVESVIDMWLTRVVNRLIR